MKSRCLALCCLVLCACSSRQQAPADAGPTPPVPPVPLGFDAYRRWDLWPRLRLGARTYMRSTFDRSGGNEAADASHFLRQEAETRNIVLDVAGHGVLSFARANHWHGSPWHYIADGNDVTVSESSTATPTAPVAGSTFLPSDVFPAPLALTWSTTRGADLSWVPVPFASSITLAYERTHYGTGYFIYTLVADPADTLSPLAGWTPAPPPDDVLELLAVPADRALPGAAQTGSAVIAAGATTPLMTVADGPAQLRELTLTVDEAAAAALGRARLRITWDDAPASAVDAPIALLFGTGSLYNRDTREYLVRSLPAVVRFHDGRVTFALYLPMPYFASARLEVASDEAVGAVDWLVRSEPLSDPPSWWGYLHATYVDHGLPVAGEDLVLLDTATVEGGGDFCGHLVGTSFIFSDRAVLGTLEGDPRFYFDDSETPQAQGTGTEEWGGGGDYWGGQTMTLPLVGHPVGAPDPSLQQTVEDGVESAYRFLLADAMPFGRRARIGLEHGGLDDSSEHYQSVTYWYGRPGACLVQTDALHVSDPEDERAHDYVSSTATIETLTSRYDRGVDHVGATEIYPATSDTGRVMTGTTELRLAVDPRNVGVLVRRKLDQGWADQRADVFVADDADGAPFVFAGSWYTAGSNACVFSNPPGELDASQPLVQTSNRRWRDDELLLPRSLTAGRRALRLRITFTPTPHPLVPGAAPPPSGWSEYRYTAYSWIPLAL